MPVIADTQGAEHGAWQFSKPLSKNKKVKLGMMADALCNPCTL